MNILDALAGHKVGLPMFLNGEQVKPYPEKPEHSIGCWEVGVQVGQLFGPAQANYLMYCCGLRMVRHDWPAGPWFEYNSAGGWTSELGPAYYDTINGALSVGSKWEILERLEVSE